MSPLSGKSAIITGASRGMVVFSVVGATGFEPAASWSQTKVIGVFVVYVIAHNCLLLVSTAHTYTAHSQCLQALYCNYLQ